MIADSADIKFACSQCGQRMVVEKSGAGLTAACPICNSPVTVPEFSTYADHISRGHRPESKTGKTARPEDFADPDFEETREELFDATISRGQLERELDVANKEAARLQVLFKKAVEECERITASATHAQAEIKSFQADRQQLKAELAQAKQRALAAEQQLGEMSTALTALQEENQGLRERVENDLEISQERLSATETQLRSRERELAALREENQELVQSLAAAQSELAAEQQQSGKVQRELDSAAQLLDEASQNESRLSATIHELHAKLEQSANDAERLGKEGERLQQQIDTLRHDLTETDSGRELLDLRAKLQNLEAEHGATLSALAATTDEAQQLAQAEQQLRDELKSTRRQRDEAERQAEANSESKLQHDNEILRGINRRDSVTIGVYHTELRRLRRARFALRIVYAIFATALIFLVIFAIGVFARKEAVEFFQSLLR